MAQPLPHPDQLTPRQREVLELVGRGLTNKEICSVLGISAGTVKVHLAAIYRVLEVTNRTEAAVALAQLAPPGPAAAAAPSDGAAPAVAVLPFDAMSEAGDEGHLADGLVEDLITLLARFRWFPVISRQSTFAYRGQGQDVQRVGAELGAAYVVEGSVRRAGPRVRVTAQLIETGRAHHVWAERYHCDIEDVFDVQDEIAGAIAAALHPELVTHEGRRAVRGNRPDVGAWELAMRGLAMVEERHPGRAIEARTPCRQALEIDPECLVAAFALGLSHYYALFLQASDDPPADVAAVHALAARCRELDRHDPYTLLLLGLSRMLAGDPDGATRALRECVETQPSFARAYSFLGQLVAMRGDPDEGIALLERALALSPRDPSAFTMQASVGICHFVAGRDEQAYHWLHRSLEQRDTEPFVWAMVACVCGVLEREEEGRLAIDELRRVQPDFTLDAFRRVAVSVRPDYVDRFVEGLERAGFPTDA